MPYKQVLTRLYTDVALSNHDLRSALTFLPDGRLGIQLSDPPESVDLGVQPASPSSILITGRASHQEVQTPDKRYQLEVADRKHQGITEFWLVHSDRANARYKRVKLGTEWRTPGKQRPRVAATPGGTIFLADDSGVVRLYSTTHLMEIGAFQMAHPDTENQIIALAISAGERLLAGLSSWKNIVLYDILERRVTFVRQIRDQVGWYDPTLAHIMVTPNADLIITIGVGSLAQQPERIVCSVNAFRFVSLKAI